MCDYSLETVASRPAKMGDRLMTCRFKRHTGGFCAVDQPHVAVCLAPGTELAFEQPFQPSGRIQRWWISLRYRGAALAVARFRRVNLETLAAHHDAVEFECGAVVLVTNMSPGQYARVVQLPAGSRPARMPTVARMVDSVA